MNAAVIGCNGYIGKHLCSFLIEKGWVLSGYDNSEFPAIPTLKYQALDIRQKSKISIIDLDVDYIFYFVGITGTSKGYVEYENYIDVNEKGILNILDWMRLNGSKARIIFPSSRLVYRGVKGKNLCEDDDKEFKTIYALNKWFGEQVIQQYSNYFGLNFNIFRICVPYGNLFSNDYSYGTVGFFVKKAMINENIVLYGPGNQKRTFTHIVDICSQIYHSIILPQSNNEIFNLNGESFSIKEIAQKIAQKHDVEIDYRAWPQLDEKLESGDTVFNSQRIQSLINQPLRYTFEKWLTSIQNNNVIETDV